MSDPFGTDDPVPTTHDDDEDLTFVEEDPVGATLAEAEAVDPSDYDPRTDVDGALPGVDLHADEAADAIEDLLD